MPQSNLGTLHLTDAQKTNIDTSLSTIESILLTVTKNLTAEERQKYGSVNEQNKLFVNKVRDYRNVQPLLSSADVDWAEYELDFKDRDFSDTRLDRIATVARMLSDFKIAHDFDNFKNGLTDYEYSQYKAGTNTPGFSEKVADLKQFFPNTGGGNRTAETPQP